MKASRFLALLCLSLTVSAQTYRSPQMRESDLNRAYQQLLHAKIFNLGGVGFASQITPEEKAFRTILESSNARKLFERLVRDANGEGQLYALFGLRLRAPEIFRTEAERVQREGGPAERTEGLMPIPKGTVRVAHGCIFYTQASRTVIDQIDKGEWDASFRASSGTLIF